MIHCGAIIASAVSQGTRAAPWTVRPEFRSDTARGDFVLAGASAGLAAAFGAPVGGVLFAVEESASRWHRALTWRTFFASVVAAYTTDFLFSGLGTADTQATGVGSLAHPGMFSFGTFAYSNAKVWSLWELPVHVALGGLGGALGAGFVRASSALARARAALVPASHPALRVAEAVLVTALFAAAKFLVPYYAGRCLPAPTAPPPGGAGGFSPFLVRFYCDAGAYNDLATLFMGPSEASIRSLFHYTHVDGSGAGATPFSPAALAAFFVVYSAGAVLANGAAWPSGLFIPALLAGSALGRLVGEALNLLPALLAPAGAGDAGTGGNLVDAGTYALIGAAALVGGTSRLTIALSAILLESTGNYIFSLPLMLTILSARVVGDALSRSVYDEVIFLKGYPVLPEHPPVRFRAVLRAADVMSPRLTVLPTLVRAGALLDTLRACAHEGVPVVHTPGVLGAHPRLGSLAGYALRRHLAVLLERRVFHAGLPSLKFTPGASTEEDIRGGRQAAAYALEPGAKRAGGEGHVGGAHGGSGGGGSGGAWGRQKLTRAATGRSAGSGGARRRAPSGGASSAAGAGATGGATGGGGGVRLRLPSLAAPLAGIVLSPGPAAPFSAVVEGGEGEDAAARVASASASAPPDGASPDAAGPPAGAAGPTSTGGGSGASDTGTGSAGPSREGSDVNLPGMLAGRAGAAAALEAAAAALRTAGGGGAPLPEGAVYADEPMLGWEALEATFPAYPDVARIELSDAEREMYVDLRPYMDPAPLTVSCHASLERAHALFTAAGARHLLVVNDARDVVGVIARADLVEAALDARLAEKAAADEARAGGRAGAGGAGAGAGRGSRGSMGSGSGGAADEVGLGIN